MSALNFPIVCFVQRFPLLTCDALDKALYLSLGSSRGLRSQEAEQLFYTALVVFNKISWKTDYENL